MNVIKYGLIVTSLSLSTAAFAASDNSISGSGQGATANQPGATEQTGGTPKIQEGRAAKSGSTDSENVPTTNGGAPKMGSAPAAPDSQGN